ncbi:MAG: dockerin type I repeat-containing protein [Ruminococcus sp.]|nr:dockerin type I repeat-containing protein [Ruminococcus sp.]
MYLVIPESVTSIANNAFDNCPDLTLGVWYGSYAYNFAKDNGISYVLLDGAKLGDANGDGSVNINDVTAIQRHLATIIALDGIRLYAADTNRDGKVDISDATNLQEFIAEYDVQDPIGEVITQ